MFVLIKRLTIARKNRTINIYGSGAGKTAFSTVTAPSYKVAARQIGGGKKKILPGFFAFYKFIKAVVTRKIMRHGRNLSIFRRYT